MSSIIIGTAGHIDHGKTTLVKALTGIDLDKSPEEKARGITISLGFTHLDLPSKRKAAFIDVPGHERLVRTMIAGATGFDAVLLCISATEGVMPQTREHLAILDLLGVRHGIVALTMTDLADEETLELAELDVEDLVMGSFLEKAPVIHTAAGTGNQGIADIIAAIDAIPLQHHNENGPFRLPIDRVFVQKGFGTVVTGTSRSGIIQDGTEVMIHPQQLTARIRGIEIHGKKCAKATPGQRVAINLAGIHHTELTRGSVVIPQDAIPLTSMIDASYSHLDSAPCLEDGMKVRFLSGATEVLARLTIIDKELLQPGETALIQLRTERPVILLPKDRFVLRRESPLETLGGGQVIDPWANRIRKKHKIQATIWLNQILQDKPEILLHRKGQIGASVLCCQLWNISGIQLGDKVYAPEVIENYQSMILQTLQRWHKEHPLQLGIQSKNLHHLSIPHLEHRAFAKLLVRLEKSKLISHTENRVQYSQFEIQLSSAQKKQLETIVGKIEASKWEGLPMESVKNKELLQLLLDKNEIIRIQNRIFHPNQIVELKKQLQCFFQDHDLLQPNDFKKITDLSRKYAIPLMEWLDQQGFTTRSEGGRKMVRINT